jgi:hypothetical protein
MLALAITLGIGFIVFQLFTQNEAVFRDQNLIAEMHQNGRVVLMQITDEIRMAGQGVPLYGSTFDNTEDEGTAVVLNGSDSTHLYIRAGVSGVESTVTSNAPIDLVLGNTRTVSVGNAVVFFQALGRLPASGRFAYVWGPSGREGYGWVRAELMAIEPATSTITLTPRQGGTAGRMAGADGVPNTTDDVFRFVSAPVISLEEVIAFYIDSGTVRRTTAASMALQTLPAWAPSAEIGQNFESLTFRYFDRRNGEITLPLSNLAIRLTVAHIGVSAVARTSEILSNGTTGRLALSAGAIPRTLRIR